MWAATEKSFSHGTVDAGVVRYLRARRASLSSTPLQGALLHTDAWLCSVRAYGSVRLHLFIWFWIWPHQKKVNFPPGWPILRGLQRPSGRLFMQQLPSVAHTASLSLLGWLFESLKRGSSVVANWSHALLVFSQQGPKVACCDWSSMVFARLCLKWPRRRKTFGQNIHKSTVSEACRDASLHNVSYTWHVLKRQ